MGERTIAHLLCLVDFGDLLYYIHIYIFNIESACVQCVKIICLKRF